MPRQYQALPNYLAPHVWPRAMLKSQRRHAIPAYARTRHAIAQVTRAAKLVYCEAWSAATPLAARVAGPDAPRVQEARRSVARARSQAPGFHVTTPAHHVTSKVQSTVTLHDTIAHHSMAQHNKTPQHHGTAHYTTQHDATLRCTT